MMLNSNDVVWCDMTIQKHSCEEEYSLVLFSTLYLWVVGWSEIRTCNNDALKSQQSISTLYNIPDH